jgi:hypothetical protein
MAVSWLQKLQLFVRGWGRRRDAAARKRDEEFLRKNTAWAAAPPSAAPRQTLQAPAENLDIEGLCVAYLDDSGRIAHYLDMMTGEAVDHRMTGGDDPFADGRRYKRVPSRSAESESTDRTVFVRGLAPSRTKSLLEQAIGRDDATAFRKTLGDDRAAERAWYSFKNDRAYAAIDSWLATLGGSAPGRRGK